MILFDYGRSWMSSKSLFVVDAHRKRSTLQHCRSCRSVLFDFLQLQLDLTDTSPHFLAKYI